jgi:hypothetical protein
MWQICGKSAEYPVIASTPKLYDIMWHDTYNRRLAKETYQDNHTGA